MPKKKVMAAISGGVDSAVMAALLLDEGYEVIGVTMDTGNPQVIQEGKAVADSLGIPHIAATIYDTFCEKVMGNFMAEYQKGRTPNPCVYCNKTIKFGALLDFVKEEKFDYYATGHYARVVKAGNRYLLYKADYGQKDQSYVLYSLGQDILSRLLLPLGTYRKDAVREKARALGLTAADKPDSQDICFIPDGDYRRFLTEHGIIGQPGDFVDTAGHILGQHQGVPYYTIGQRKGLGIALGYPVYVVALDVAKNQVILGREDELYRTSLLAENCNFIPFPVLTEPLAVTARVRYKSLGSPAIIRPYAEGLVEVVFEKPEKAVTPGQSVVFYQENLVVGGGTIC